MVAMGENLTVTGLDPARWRTGQRYAIGEDAVIELTTLRQPCVKLHLYGRCRFMRSFDARRGGLRHRARGQRRFADCRSADRAAVRLA